MKKNNIEEKVQTLFNYITNYTEKNGYSPSVRDICKDLSIKSTATAYDYLERLNKQGLINKSPFKKRALGIVKNRFNVENIPVIGEVTAGQPIFAVENYDEFLPIPTDLFKEEDLFILKVKGESMIEAGIYNGDKIIVKKQNFANNGEIVVALIEDSATVKRFFKEKNYFRLHPENSAMDDMIYYEIDILGKVIGLIRKF